MKINGFNISWPAILAILTAAFWLGSLSFQVYANSSILESRSDTSERLARIETQLVNIERQLNELNDAR